MRPERLYLGDIIEACDAIARFLEPIEKEDFLHDELRQSAVLQKFIVIGEAATRLPTEFRERHANVPWSRAAGLRNVAVHEYFSVSWEIIWVTATQDIPSLRDNVGMILESGLDDDEAHPTAAPAT